MVSNIKIKIMFCDHKMLPEIPINQEFHVEMEQ